MTDLPSALHPRPAESTAADLQARPRLCHAPALDPVGGMTLRRPGAVEFGLCTATAWALWLLITAFLRRSYCRRESALLRRGAGKVAFAASDAGKVQ